MKKCSSCENKHYAKGFCRKHYVSWRYENDSEFRERSIKEAYKRTKDRKLIDPVFRDKFRDQKNTYMKNKYHSDPEFKKRKDKSSAIRATLRKKRLKQATPSWVDKEELKRFWENRPDGHHVDHIVPIKGKEVCGLNVPWNLQYLPSQDNLKKSNKF
jgi:hypothetical protein